MARAIEEQLARLKLRLGDASGTVGAPIGRVQERSLELRVDDPALLHLHGEDHIPVNGTSDPLRLRADQQVRIERARELAEVQLQNQTEAERGLT